MRLVFMIVVVAHGLIHLMGFVKAFGLAEIEELTKPISQLGGILWLLTTLTFLAVAFLYLTQKGWWWMPAVIAVALSQILIMMTWQDAKFGTIANIVILVAVIIGGATWNFNAQINKEIDEIISPSQGIETKVITAEMLEHLPLPVQKWLNNSGIVGKEQIQTMYLKQTGLMKLKPDQKEWYQASAEQYITTAKPAFHWRVNMQMLPLINVVGRDIYIDGKTEMNFKLASLFTVAKAANNPKVNQAALQRYMLELAWYPSAALNPNVTWEEIDAYTAKATMADNGVTASVTFHFDDQGDLVRGSAWRYMGSDDSAQLVECIAELKNFSVIDGIKIPTQVNISWALEEGLFTWYKLEAHDIKFN